MKYYAGLFAILLLHGSLFAQNSTIDSVWFESNSGKIYISVSGIKEPKSRLTFSLKSEKSIFNPDFKNITNITGQNVHQKVASWNFKNEALGPIKGSYIPVANIIPLVPFKPGRNVVSSVIWPGMGGKELRGSNLSWIKGLIGWGLLATGSFLMINSNNQYNKIASSRTKAEADAVTTSYNTQFYGSVVCFGSAAAIWTIDLATITKRNRKARSYIVEYGTAGSCIPDFKNKTELMGNAVLLDARPKFDILIEKAEGFFKENNYENAKPLYIEALTYKPKDSLTTARLNVINDKLYKGKRALPPNLYAQLSFSDDNGNGILEALETATLKIILSNKGEGYANNLQLKVADNKRDTALSFVNQKIEILRNGESQTIEIPIRAGLDIKTDQHRLEINVLEQYGFDMDPAFLVLSTYAYNPPKINLSGLEIIDRGEGTAAIKPDGSVQPGEKVKVKMIMQNIGQSDAENTTWNVTTKNDNIYIDNNYGNLGKFKIGEIKEVFFYLTPNKRVTGLDTLPVYLSVKEKVGRASFNNLQLPVVMEQKPVQPIIVNVKPDITTLQKVVASFEYKSQKFTVNLGQLNDIRKVTESKIVRNNAIAVVIGIEKYQNIPPAPYAANDAEIMEEYFKKRLGIKSVILLLNEEVNSTRLRKIFNPEYGDLQRSVVKGETDVFVYYSGHGIPNKAGSKIFLFPNDGMREGVEDFGYDIDKLYADLNKIEARTTTVILDACFSGSSRASEKVLAENISGAKGIKIQARTNAINYPNFTIISSSTGEETSLGLDASESGLFTYYFCNGLSGSADSDKDHKITLGELKNYVTDNVKKASVKISGLQTPQFNGDEKIVLVEY